jgi:hypothetical protein
MSLRPGTRLGAYEVLGSGSAPIRVSQNGGREPVWSRNGRELFYLQGTKVIALTVKPSGEFAFEPPVVLFDGPYLHSPETGSSQVEFSRSFDVAPDGRFLMLLGAGETAAPQPHEPTGIVVVQNWSEELKRLVPVQ